MERTILLKNLKFFVDYRFENNFVDSSKYFVGILKIMSNVVKKF